MGWVRGKKKRKKKIACSSVLKILGAISLHTGTRRRNFSYGIKLSEDIELKYKK